MNSSGKSIRNTFYLLVSTLIILSLVCHAIPQAFFKNYNIRKVDYITPIVLATDKQKPVQAAKTAKVKKVKRLNNVEFAIPTGITALEDFSIDGGHLDYFLEALHDVKSGSGKDNCRIAFYGDSFIEGDILTMSLRDSLQNIFGGKGIGFLPISSEVSMFRQSLQSESDHWKVNSIVSKSKDALLGISGKTFVPQAGASVKLYPRKKINGIHLLYSNIAENQIVNTVTNKKYTASYVLNSGDGLISQTLSYGADSIHHYNISLPENKDLMVYGLNIENGRGVYLDNFSIRGNSGLGMKSISDKQYLDFQKQLKYKLVVLQFGLNVAAPTSTDFSIYEKNMVKMISHLKTLFPKTSFLLVSTSDRSYKQNGTYTTMPSIPLMVEAQRRIAKESGIVFWSMYQAMGGENSMVDFVKAHQANKDYTHLTFSGGNKVATALLKSLLFEYENYKSVYDHEEVQVSLR
jgi:lysophospholipase L1-like esterase